MGLLGAFVPLLPGPPTVFLGAINAIALVEYQRHKSWDSALKASGSNFAGYVISLLANRSLSAKATANCEDGGILLH